MFIKIPVDKINHEVLSEIPNNIKDKIKADLSKNQDKQNIDYYYIHLEKMMNPEYRTKLFREYLRDEIKNKYDHLITKDPNIVKPLNSINIYDYFTAKNLGLVIFLIWGPLVQYFFPEEFKETLEI
uniref:Uncharacterized protein n=1 Tax=Inonotus obliquus TaxID=167356 RepID=A0A5A4U8J3_9AGAM|nr:hypothetical protein [Inonotus obliquus]BBN21307.1 hypothetical protein [Inonotus obliquus]